MTFPKPSLCDAIILCGIVGLLVLSPFVSAGMDVWAHCLTQLTVFLLVILWFTDRLGFTKAGVLEWVRAPVNLFLLAVVALAWCQVVPLPAGLVKHINPALHAEKLQLLDILAKSSGIDGTLPFWMVPAPYRHPVVLENLRLTVSIGIYFLLLNTLRSKRLIDLLVLAVIAAGFLEALFGVYQTALGSGAMHDGRQAISGLSAPFAYYLQIGFLLCFGMLMDPKRRPMDIEPGLKSSRASYRRLLGRFSGDSWRLRSVFLVAAAVLMAIATALSASSSSMFAFGGAMLAVSMLLFGRRGMRGRGIVAFCLCGIAVAYGLVLRTGTPAPISPPVPVHGGGSGAVLTILVCLAVVVFLVRLYPVWRQRRDPHALGLGAAALAGVVNTTMHICLFDGIYSPVYITLAALCMAVGYRAVHRHGRGPSESFSHPMRRIPVPLGIQVITVIAVLAISGFGTLVAGRHLLAETYCPTDGGIGSLDNIDRAIALDPNNAEYRFCRAEALGRMPYSAEMQRTEDRRQRTEDRGQRTEDRRQRTEDRGQRIGTRSGIDLLERTQTAAEFGRIRLQLIISSLEEAVRLDPTAGIYWYELGRHYAQKDDDAYRYLHKWLPLAEACFGMAIRRSPEDAEIRQKVAEYWVWRSSIVTEREAKQRAVLRFQEHYQRLLTMKPDRWKRAVDAVWAYYPEDAVVLAIVPKENQKLRRVMMRYAATKD